MCLLHLRRRIEDNTYGKKVVNIIKLNFLLFQLTVDGMDGFCTALDIVFQAGLIEAFL
ncbi:hypothetical protein SDC9_85976 [bioreactor metagenome]|uniref:Uncharacterized protein n=1 Tax=bioreactor metagenome TaxID=1076179 RepID=A0A644ZKX9_9ZZZZ